ncbi:uncharacterized protein LOC126335186 isoform X2 [Schistocerca gregaria]|uniref:uncharacterized protein LOC126335186 isoform X2 n=1 Tax=Schistocerca gregaria TaxID=7010 RepID=UPI00211E0370|nr:uncharacterized protein LOC126335186 isoform X2 [Schistocerca gregaria]
MRMRGGRAPPAALLCLALALLSAAAASWLLASRAAAPPPLPPPTPPTPPVRTIVAYSQRRLHELARRPPLTCDSDIGAPPPVDRVGDAYSAEGWEELLAPGFSDDGWPPEAFGLSAAARPLSGAGGRSTVTEGHVYDTATSAVAENVIERVERTMELGEVLQGTVYDYSGFPIKDGDNQSTADADFEVRQQLPRRDSLDDKGGLADYGGWLPPDVGTAVWPVARQWARVPGGGAWLLSAHGDRRLRDFQYVRLLAVGGRPRQRLFCRLRLTGDSASVLLEAQPTALWPAQWGDGDPASQPYLLSCSLPANLTVDQVASVSVAADHPCAPPSQELHLEPPLVPEDRPGANRRDFAVCLKALHFPDREVSGRLAWWVEVLRLLGAQHVVAHVSAVGVAAQRVLRHYQARGLLTAQRLVLPGDARGATSATATLLRKRRMEVLAYNHCLYSNLERFRFVLPLDIDEVWLPTRNWSWRGLLAQLVSEQRDVLVRHASLSARNVYLVGGGAFWSAGAAAAKSLVRTAAALAVAHHAASRPASRLLLPPHRAALAHFRAACPQQEAPECRSPPAQLQQPLTPSLSRWQPRLRRAVRRTLQHVFPLDLIQT